MTGINLPEGVELAPNLKARHLQLRRVWCSLPSGPWASNKELEEAIVKAADLYLGKQMPGGPVPGGDYATAGAIRSSFFVGRAVVKNEDGLLVKAGSFPEYRDTGPGTPEFNQYLREESERQRREFDEQIKRDRENARQLDTGWQQTQAAIREATEPLYRRIAELEAEREHGDER